jgi:hypothetical protein
VFFSVDGGHTAELTENDIRVAEASVADDGVVAVDDVFNERWPSVMLGLGRYLGDGSPVLVPCAIGGGKVFLAKGADRARELATALQDDHSTAIGYITSASSTALGNWPVTVLETKIRAETLLRGIAGTPLGVSASRSFLGRRLKTLLRPFY